MPAFPKFTPTKFADFSITLAIVENPPAPASVTLTISAALSDATGSKLHRFSGDLREFISAAEATALESKVLALYARAKTEMLT